MYDWIDAEQFSFNALLLMDRFMFRVFADNSSEEFKKHLGRALAGNPAVRWYAMNKCPENADYFKTLSESSENGLTAGELRESEVYVLDALDWAIVYVYPDLMEELPYIKEWDAERLLSMADFKGKAVLDIGAGTGRLTFTAAPLARVVYAVEPVDRLREYMREKAKRLRLDNVYVVDGTVEALPFEAEFFDITVSGHVIGDDYDTELSEMERVTKPGGWIIDCPGEEHRKKPVDDELVRRGFERSHYASKTGGDVYRYRRQKL